LENLKGRDFGDTEEGERIMDFKEFVYAVWTGFIGHNIWTSGRVL
jgi:hypothetical protein